MKTVVPSIHRFTCDTVTPTPIFTDICLNLLFMFRSASESSMDTSESHSSGKGATPAPAPAPAPTAGDVNEADVANMMAMGFSREACVQELRNNNGDVNLAVAAIFAKSLSDSFAKKK